MRDDSWHHVAVTRDSTANQIIFYTDGQINGVFTAGSNADGQWPLGIGNDLRTPGIPFHGLIEEVRLWNVVRTAQEIRENMHHTLTGSETGLISYWQFNEAAGDTTYDPVGGHNGTLYNMDAADWVTSSVPAGGGSSFTQIVSTTGVFDFSGTNLSMDFTAKAGTDTIVVSRIELAPNTIPTSNIDIFDSQYWITNKFGSGIFTSDLIFTPNEVIVTKDESFPDVLRLFDRVGNSDGSWINMMGAASASAANNTVTYDSISAFSQFLIGRQWFSDINAGLTGVFNGSVAWEIMTMTATWIFYSQVIQVHLEFPESIKIIPHRGRQEPSMTSMPVIWIFCSQVLQVHLEFPEYIKIIPHRGRQEFLPTSMPGCPGFFLVRLPGEIMTMMVIWIFCSTVFILGVLILPFPESTATIQAYLLTSMPGCQGF